VFGTKGRRYPGLWLCLIIVTISSYAKAVQYSIESDIDSRFEYNDNIFITSQEHDSVSGLTVTPSARITAKEADWQSYLNASLRNNNYSDHALDSNDIFLDASGKYAKERDIFTLAAGYDKDSNLNILSSDFGIAGKRVNRTSWSITPQYTRLLTQRLYATAGYTHSDVEYEEITSTGYVPYELDTLNGSFAYNLSERNIFSLIVQATDYSSKNKSFEYQLHIFRVGIEHQFSELWKGDFTIGGSRRDSTSRFTQSFDFFGQPITLTQETDFSDKGYVFDGGLEKKHETGSFSVRASRDNLTNSYGGLNNVDSLKCSFKDKVTQLWSYQINARYENINAVSGTQRSTDREALFFEPKLYYSIARNWTASITYRYVQRKFKHETSDITPHSNRIYIGITYNFPEISTF
jgi:hypothetical protein